MNSKRYLTQSMAFTASLLLCLVAESSLAQTYTVLHTFTGSDGAEPWYGRLLLSSNTLYGVTPGGGSDDDGVLFQINTDGSGYTVLKNFSGGDGRGPAGELCLAGTTLYGTTEYGGASNQGTVFRINTDGSEYAVVKNFTGNDGSLPCGGVILSGNTLYGTTSSGGDFGWGTVFRVNTDGNGYVLLKSFDFGSSDGAEPIGTLILSGATLYGTTAEGAYVAGSVFRINTDGSGFSILKVLGDSAGKWPCSPVLLSGGTLYGTADWGGSGFGTVFCLNTNGGAFTVLRSFTGGSDGAGIEAGLLLSGDTLYGTAYEGGDYPYEPPYYGHGTVFRLKTDGTGFLVLKQFSGSDGAYPSTGLVLSGSTLYGMAHGGSSNKGVIFALATLPTATLAPPGQTVETGSSVKFSAHADGPGPTSYSWLFNTNTLLSTGTNSLLVLTNVQTEQAGVYMAAISNILGAATSSPAMLQVIPQVERRMVPGVRIFAPVGSEVNIEYTDALASRPSWLFLDSVTMTGPAQFYFDVTARLPEHRFYRVSGITARVAPLLALDLVPAITVTGAIGDSVRVDAINQIGPTDAWVTLDTVTLTNNAQLYFDISAIGQPQRLYRVATP